MYIKQSVLPIHDQLIDFENRLPAGFWDPIKKEVETIMNMTKKGNANGPKILYDTHFHE
jgi:hypothetical protein